MGRLRLRLLGILKGIDMNAVSDWLSRFATPVVRWVALLGLCAAYLQGGIVKLANFNEALAEMNHFGVSPAMPFAIAVIALELVASVAILTGYWRWLGALALGAFTVAATFMANRYWELGPAERFGVENFFLRASGTRRWLPSGCVARLA